MRTSAVSARLRSRPQGHTLQRAERHEADTRGRSGAEAEDTGEATSGRERACPAFGSSGLHAVAHGSRGTPTHHSSNTPVRLSPTTVTSDATMSTTVPAGAPPKVTYAAAASQRVIHPSASVLTLTLRASPTNSANALSCGGLGSAVHADMCPYLLTGAPGAAFASNAAAVIVHESSICAAEGARVPDAVGAAVPTVGAAVGAAEGEPDGTSVGTTDGLAVD
jgi:hypothetical protein